jgi:hypothetical protein
MEHVHVWDDLVIMCFFLYAERARSWIHVAEWAGGIFCIRVVFWKHSLALERWQMI